MSAQVFKGGVPVEPEIRALMTAFTSETWPESAVVSYQQIEAVTGAKYGTNRARTIVASWRRKLAREQNVDTEVVPCVGVKKLAPGARLEAGQRDGRKSTRAFRRALIRVNAVPAEKLTPEELHSKDHTVRLFSSVVSAAQSACREISAPKPVQALPRAKVG